MTDLIPRTTLTQIAAHRDKALALYGDARDLIEAANAKMREAGEALRAAAPTANLDIFRPDDRAKLFGSLQVAERDEFMGMARHMVDADVWTHVVNATDLQRLMDKKAKDKLREQLRTEPAEFTEATVLATLQEDCYWAL